jgi:dTDP-4-dehydrorhamnose reductase
MIFTVDMPKRLQRLSFSGWALARIECTVSPINSDKLDRAAKRPAFSSLDNMMLRCTVGNVMRKWEKSLRVLMSHIDS